MKYIPTLDAVVKETIVALVSLVVANLLIRKIPALKKLVYPNPNQ